MSLMLLVLMVLLLLRIRRLKNLRVLGLLLHRDVNFAQSVDICMLAEKLLVEVSSEHVRSQTSQQ